MMWLIRIIAHYAPQNNLERAISERLEELDRQLTWDPEWIRSQIKNVLASANKQFPKCKAIELKWMDESDYKAPRPDKSAFFEPVGATDTSRVMIINFISIDKNQQHLGKAIETDLEEQLLAALSKKLIENT